MEWPRGGARGVCRQVRVVGVASRGLSLYGGVSWYATDAGGLGWPAVVSAVLYGAYSYVCKNVSRYRMAERCMRAPRDRSSYVCILQSPSCVRDRKKARPIHWEESSCAERGARPIFMATRATLPLVGADVEWLVPSEPLFDEFLDGCGLGGVVACGGHDDVDAGCGRSECARRWRRARVHALAISTR